MPWEPPPWTRSSEEVNDRWMGTCRKFVRHEQFFEALGWGDRLNRLFAVACTRAAFGKKLNERSIALLDLIERVAEGTATQEELTAESNAIFDEMQESFDELVHEAAYVPACMIPHFAAGWFARQKKHRETFGKILAAMVGPGWTWKDHWRTEPVISVAQGIYDERAWDRMPILADALIDAGLDDSRIRIYCRGQGPFMRGCWVLDQILKKRE